MSTYDAHLVLQTIDKNVLAIAVFGAVAGILTFVYFYEAIRLGFKHRAYSAPLAATVWFLPHDFSFVLQYDQWFNVYNHWWCKAWWAGLVATVGIEIYLVYQPIKYGREELMPEVSQSTFAWSVIGATLGAGVMWAIVKNSMDDQLFFISFLLTIVWPIPFATVLLRSRKSRKGTSLLQQGVLVPMYLGLWGVLYIADPYFRSPSFIALTVVTIVWGLYNVRLTQRLPDYQAP